MLVRKGELYLDKDSKTLLRSVFLGGWSSIIFVMENLDRETSG